MQLDVINEVLGSEKVTAYEIQYIKNSYYTHIHKISYFQAKRYNSVTQIRWLLF